MASSLPRRQDATLPPVPADDAVGSAVAQLVGSAPETLDTLGELAAALTADEGTAATLAALIGTKAPLNSPAFTGTVTGITAAMVGLGAVDNTPDSAKPVSTAQQAALNTKASTASPAFTGIVTGITAAMVAADPAGAATAAQAAAVQRANHTGTQTADTVTDGVLNKAYTGTERTKLAGVATGATANSADATLLNRANHTGTQAASTVTGLAPVATSGAYADLTGKPAATSPAYPTSVLMAAATWSSGYPTLTGGLVQLTVQATGAFDPGSHWDGSYYTCDAAGYYLVILKVGLNDNVVNNISWGLSANVINNLDYISWTKTVSGASTNRNSWEFVRMLKCNTGDKIRPLAYADTNAGLTVSGADFQVLRVA